jgi:hypothetical protein
MATRRVTTEPKAEEPTRACHHHGDEWDPRDIFRNPVPPAAWAALKEHEADRTLGYGASKCGGSEECEEHRAFLSRVAESAR